MNTHFYNNVHPPDLFLRSPLHFSKNSILLSGYFPLLLLCFLLRVQICLSMWEYFQPRLPWSSQMDPKHSFLYLQRRTSKHLRSMVWHYSRLISVHVAPALALPHNEAQRLQISCVFRFPRIAPQLVNWQELDHALQGPLNSIILCLRTTYRDLPMLLHVCLLCLTSPLLPFLL